jgi:uncharacterized OB-fold protein
MANEKCLQCGAALVLNAAYCDMCGHRLASSPTHAAASSLIIEWVPITGLPLANAGAPGRSGTVQCSHCGSVNLPNSAFCDRCGTKLT